MALERLIAPNFADKLRRAIWQLISAPLYRATPEAFYAWRRVLLRMFGAQIAGTARPSNSAKIWAPWNLVMESGSRLCVKADCYNVARITLREGCVVADHAYLCSGSHDVEGTDFGLTGAPIEIGAGALVSTGAFVGPGVTMADYSVAELRAIVTKDVSVGNIVTGDPARVVGQREIKTERPS